MKRSRILREVNETLEAIRRVQDKTHSPPHPGEVLKASVLRPDGGITIAEFAKRLRIPRAAFSRMVNGKAAVSAELAIRLAAALRGSAESWLRMQAAFDLWRARRSRRPKIEPVDPNSPTVKGLRMPIQRRRSSRPR
jgi:antitoxin HigA-1